MRRSPKRAECAKLSMNAGVFAGCGGRSTDGDKGPTLMRASTAGEPSRVGGRGM